MENTKGTVYLGQSMGNNEHQDETLLHRQRENFYPHEDPQEDESLEINLKV